MRTRIVRGFVAPTYGWVARMRLAEVCAWTSIVGSRPLRLSVS